MRHDSDFEAYLAARWAPAVRTLVLLGSPETRAAALALSGFASCYADWGELRELPDPDAEVYRILLEALDPDALATDHRAALVLRHVAGLSDVQVAYALDRPFAADAEGDERDEEVLREAADAVEVPPPSFEAVRDEARARRRRTARRVAAAVGVLALAVGVATWVGTRPGPEPAAAAPEVTRVENVADVAWWANGLLHLPHVSVALGRLADLVEIGDGAVIGDEQGGVSYVAADGSVTELGRKAPGAALVGSGERGWAAWVEVGDDSPAVVVHDVAAGRVLATFPLSPGASAGLPDGAEPIAIEGTMLYFVTGDGAWEWPLPEGAPHLVDPASLAARGIGADTQVSESGTYRLTLEPSATGSAGQVHIRETGSGREVWTGLRDGDALVAATLGPDDEVTYIVARADDAPQAGEFLRQSFSGPYELRTCRLDEHTCATVMLFPHTGRQPVLPH
ncbi:MAG: hypothetical protein JWO76_2415 [Nocardioides sp.]|nr:hypothetical protein [Nocardioides sp.]